MKITDALREYIRKLECELYSTSEAEKNTAREIKHTTSQAYKLWSVMNFRERKLGGWFGGNKKRVTQYSELMVKIAKLSLEIKNLQYKIKRINQRIEESLDRHLRGNDKNYDSLIRPHHTALTMKQTLDAFLTKIDHALYEIDDAKAMEVADLLTKNKGISFISSLENSEANEAIRQVQASVGQFQEAIQNYKDFLKNYQVPQTYTEIDDSVDLIFDFIYEDKFDFTSIFTISALENARTQMSFLRMEVLNIDQIVCTHLNKSNNSVRAYVLSARVACV